MVPMTIASGNATWTEHKLQQYVNIFTTDTRQQSKLENHVVCLSFHFVAKCFSLPDIAVDSNPVEVGLVGGIVCCCSAMCLDRTGKGNINSFYYLL